MVLASESRRKGCSPSIKCLVVDDKERMKPGHWLGSVLCVPFSTLTLVSRWQDGHPVRNKTIPLIPRGTVSEQVKDDSSGKTAVK